MTANGRRPAALYLKPNQHVRTLTPPWPDAPTLNPDSLYITSGEAVMKTRQLYREIEALARQTLILPPDHPFCAECIHALDETDRLLNLLIETRGKHVLLECEWEEGQVRCRCTDPRPRDLSEYRGDACPSKNPRPASA